MIVNPVYVGKIAYGRRRTEVIEGTRGETHVVKSDGYEVYDGRHEAIIDEATWAAAQAIVGTRKPNAKRHDDGHVNLLNGLLVCPECGRKMSSHPNRGKVKKDGTRGKTTYAYYCPHASKARGATCTFSRQYPQEYVDAEVIEMVKLASRSDAFVEALRRRINDETDVEQLREDAERIGREQAANDKRMRMLMNQIDALDPADRSYESAKRKLDFVVKWLYQYRNKTGQWDFGSQAKDGVHFPLSDRWDANSRVVDSTYRVNKVLSALGAERFENGSGT